MAMLGARYPDFSGIGLPTYTVDMPPSRPPAAKHNWVGILADALAGLAGQGPMYAPMAERRAQEQTAFERGNEQYRRQRADHLADDQTNFDQQLKLADYKRAHPDDEFSRYMASAGIDPGSPAGQALYLQRVNSMANPPRFMTGPNGEVIQVGGQAPNIPTTPVGKLRPIGGATVSPSGNFP